MGITVLGILIIVISIVTLIFGSCYLLSKYTDIGFWEPIIVFAVIAVIAYIFNANTFNVMLVAALVTLLLGITALWLVFLFYFLVSVIAKSRMAKLVKTEIPEGKKSRFAFYDIDGKTFQCVIGGASKKTDVGKVYRVKYSRLLGKVFDKRAVILCMGGVIVGVLGALMFILPILFMEDLPI
jgi:hypothetical protein